MNLWQCLKGNAMESSRLQTCLAHVQDASSAAAQSLRGGESSVEHISQRVPSQGPLWYADLRALWTFRHRHPALLVNILHHYG